MTMTMKGFEAKKVSCLNRTNFPEENEDFSTDFEISPEMISAINKIDIYFRGPEDCPYGRGNWIIDILLKNEIIMCVKLRKEMTLEEVKKYIKPLKLAIKKMEIENDN